MISFASDYVEGAQPRILEALLRTNLEQLSGYGTDIYCDRAKEKIRAAIGAPEAEIFFLSGGTQANQVVISALLRPYEAVLSASTGHVNAHEAGAIELSGHKVLALPAREGKLDPAAAEDYLEAFYADENHEHMAFPGMIYLSWPTELGTLYSKAELEQFHALCRKYQIPLFLDGARLGYGLASAESDLTLPELAKLCDVFYIGGTKVGALLGEAVVFPEPETCPAHFLTMVKQRGALLAKGRVLGIQFDTLFTDELYLELGRHAIKMAEELKQVLREKSVRFYLESPTNQQFVILENERLARLQEHVVVSYWEPYSPKETVVRLCTSWATRPEAIRELEEYL